MVDCLIPLCRPGVWFLAEWRPLFFYVPLVELPLLEVSPLVCCSHLNWIRNLQVLAPYSYVCWSRSLGEHNHTSTADGWGLRFILNFGLTVGAVVFWNRYVSRQGANHQVDDTVCTVADPVQSITSGYQADRSPRVQPDYTSVERGPILVQELAIKAAILKCCSTVGC